MACLEILLDKPQTLEPGVAAGNMHDKSFDYSYLVVIQLKKQPANQRQTTRTFMSERLRVIQFYLVAGRLMLFKASCRQDPACCLSGKAEGQCCSARGARTFREKILAVILLDYLPLPAS